MRGEGVRRGNYPCLIEKLTVGLPLRAAASSAHTFVEHQPLFSNGTVQLGGCLWAIADPAAYCAELDSPHYRCWERLSPEDKALGVRLMIGMLPKHAGSWARFRDQIRTLCETNPSVVAVGPAGLDLERASDPETQQRQVQPDPTPCSQSLPLSVYVYIYIHWVSSFQ